MSDRFDLELKKALKDSTAKSLEGWEFSPSMRQAVLKRIVEEEAAPPPAPAPVRRPRQSVNRPVMWMAAAAAALFVTVNMMQLDLGFGGGARKSAEAPKAASYAPAAKEAAPEVAQKSIPGGKGEPKSESTSGSAGIASANTEAFSKAAPPADAGQQESASADMAIAQAAVAAPARIHLVVPDSDEAGARVAPPVATLKAPDNGVSTMTAAQPEVLGMARIGSQAAVRTRNSLQLVDKDGAVIWEKPLSNGPGLVVTLNGTIATSDGSDLYLFDTDGRQTLKLGLPAGPEGLTLSPDGRVAVLMGPAGVRMNLQLVVYENGKVQFQVNDLGDGTAAFGPDGSLAVRGNGTLQLFGRNGAVLWKTPVQTAGLGLSFAAGGEVIVAGGQAFHRSGQPLWDLSAMRTQNLFTLGTDGPVVLWESRQLTLVRPEDGTEIWTAEHSGRQILAVASSDSGDQVAILASVDEAAVVWVLDQNGGLRYSEKLTVQPSGLAVEGDTLMLLMPGGAEPRALPPR